MVNNAALRFSRSDATSFGGSISGTGSLTKLGADTLTLTGSNSYSGSTRVAAGTLVLGSTSALAGSTLDLNAADSGTVAFAMADMNTYELGGLTGSRNLATSGTVRLSVGANGQSTTYTGVLFGVGSLTKTGAGTLVLTASSTLTGPITVQAGTLALGDGGTTGPIVGNITSLDRVMFNRADDLTYGGTISGSGGLTKAGAGTLTLSESNGFTGTTRVGAGVLALANTEALAGSTLDLNAADAGTVAFTRAGINTYVLGGLTGSRNLAMGATANLSIGSNNASSSYAGSLSGAGSLTKLGTGILTLTGSNSHTGGTTISSGTLDIGNGGTTGSIPGVVINNAALRFNRSNTVSFGGSISGSGSLTKLGAGTLTLSGSNSYTGSTRVVTGTLALVNTFPLAGSTLDLNAADSGTVAFFTLGGTNTFVLGGLTGSRNLVASGSIRLAIGANGQSTTYSGRLVGFDAVTKVGAGTLTLSGSNSYGGVTSASAGTLLASTPNALPGYTSTGRVVFDGGTLQVPLDGDAWTASQVDVLAGNATKTSGVLALDVPSGSQTLPSGISGAIGLTKTGAGTLALSGSSSYTGGTVVSAGTLALASAGSINASTAVAVAAGAVFDVSAKAGGYAVPSGQTLSGNGTVAGSVTLGAGATLSPGASPGLITVTGSTTFGAGGNYNWQVFSATGTAGTAAGWDLLSVGGVLDVAATSADPFRVNLWSLSGTGPDVSGNAANWSATTSGTWRIASAAGGITNFSGDKFQLVTGAANGTGGFSNSLSGGTFSLAQSGNNLNLVFTAAPPPVITITVAGGQQTQAAAGFPLLSGTTPVVKTGLGTLVLDQANPLTGSTTVAQGKLQLADVIALSSSRVVPLAGGTLALTAYLQTTVGGLDPNAGGLTDVGNGLMTVAGGLSATDMLTAITAGYQGGTWAGTTGITSSVAAAESVQVTCGRSAGSTTATAR